MTYRMNNRFTAAPTVDDFSHVTIAGYKPARVQHSQHTGEAYVRCEPVIVTTMANGKPSAAIIDFRAANKLQLRADIESRYPNAVFSKGSVLNQREQDLHNLAAIRESTRRITPEEINTAKLRLERLVAKGLITANSTDEDIARFCKSEGISDRVRDAINAEGNQKLQEMTDAETQRLGSAMSEVERRGHISAVVNKVLAEPNWQSFVQGHQHFMSYGFSANSHENFNIFVDACKLMGYQIPSLANARALLVYLVNNKHMYFQNGFTRSRLEFGGRPDVRPFTGMVNASKSRIPPEDVEKCVKMLIARNWRKPTLEQLSEIGVANPPEMMRALAARFGGNNSAAEAEGLHTKTAAELREDLNQSRIDRDKQLTTQERMQKERRTY